MIDIAFARRHLDTGISDAALQEKLNAAEAAVKAYTNNAFPAVRFPDGLPEDVRMGIVRMVDWQLAVDKKAGIASETISRHSVTYAQAGEDSIMGFPQGLMAFCKPYRRART